jgi:hypothetical protein
LIKAEFSRKASLKYLQRWEFQKALVKIENPGADPSKPLRKTEESGGSDQSEAVIKIEISQGGAGTLEACDPRKR